MGRVPPLRRAPAARPAGCQRRLPRSLIGEAAVAVSILLLAAILVDSKPPPKPGAAAHAGRAGPPVASCRCAWAISGGAGFLGLHLARRLLADGHEVRTLDLAPLDEPDLERSVEELRGDVRSVHDARALVDGADVLVHAAAALPIQASRESIRSVNVGGPATLLAAAAEAGVRRDVLVSSTAVYGIPKVHPIHEGDPLVGVGWYGESKIEAEEVSREFGRRGLEFAIVRPKTFIGPERLGVFEILFDWIREGRRISTSGAARTATSCSRSRISSRRSCWRPSGRGRGGDGQRRRRVVRHGARRSPVADRPRRVASRLTPVPVRPAEIALRALELLHVSPLAEWHYKTAHRDSFVAIEHAEELLGWSPRLSNERGAVPHVRLVPRPPRHALRGGGHPPRAVEPAGAGAAQARQLRLRRRTRSRPRETRRRSVPCRRPRPTRRPRARHRRRGRRQPSASPPRRSGPRPSSTPRRRSPRPRGSRRAGRSPPSSRPRTAGGRRPSARSRGSPDRRGAGARPAPASSASTW